MKDFLQGKWFRHPLHPILVHVPTALWPAAFIFDLLAWFGLESKVMVQLSFYAILLGLLAALLAAPTGLADWLDIKPDKPARKIGWYHLLLNIAASVIWLVNLIWRTDPTLNATTVSIGPLVLSGLGTFLLLISGYLGGLMVHDYGISVARQSKQKWRQRAEAGGARVPSE